MKLTCVGIWQGSSTEIWTHQSLIRRLQLCWLHRGLQEMVTQACTLWVFLPGFTNTHIHTPHLQYAHTYAGMQFFFLRQNNCVPPLAVKSCQCLVSAGIGWVVAGSIRKGQSGSVCTVTLSAGWTDTAGSALSVWSGLIHGGWVFTQTPQRGVGLFGYNLSAVNII